MWKIGPECAAQQAKKVSASTMNCGERNACATEQAVPSASGAAPSRGWPAGGWRTSNAAGISSTQATMPMTSIANRQS